MPLQKLKEAYQTTIQELQSLRTNAYVSDIFKKYSDVCFCLDKRFGQICYPGYKCGNCVPTDVCKQCDPNTSC